MPEQPKPSGLDAAIEAEIEAALGDMSVEDILADSTPRRTAPGERDFRTGTVVSIHGGDILVEFGPKTQGVCPVEQFPDSPPEIGSRVEFVVDRVDQAENLLMLSREGAVRKADWESLDVGQIVEAKCTGTNKGGLDIEIANHRAFMPAGHVDLHHIDDLEVFVGEKMTCEIIELDRHRGRIVASRRIPLEAERARKRVEILEGLQVGETRPAVITTIKPYGAFADLGGIDGLIHISDLSYQRVSNPEEVVKPGAQVNVKVLKVDRDQEPPRIGLGLKQTLEDPYMASAGAMEPGAIVSGRVTKLMDFGAFVELAPGVEGLIHISELSRERVQKVGNVVKVDEVVNVKVLSVDTGQRRIALSLKQAQEAHEQDTFQRSEDPEMRKLRAQLNQKFGDNLKGGLG